MERDATLTVRAPQRASMEAINGLVHGKREWIRRKQEHARKTYEAFKPREYARGESFYYLGNLYELSIVENLPTPLVFDQGFFLSEKYKEKARNVFIRWYKRQALLKITERVEYWAGLSGTRQGRIRINSASKRWGSCGHAGNLNFSWRLVMAPPAALDYVVVHELSHLRHMNHSADFWNTVWSFIPDYKTGEQWLKENGHLLDA